MNRFARKPINGQTAAQRMHAELVALGKRVTAAQYAEHKGVSRDIAADRLQRGVKAGWLVSERQSSGKGRPSVFVVVKRPKPDGRGKSAGSKEALLIYWRCTPATLANLLNVKGRPRPPIEKRHPLEQAWRTAWTDTP